MPVYRTSDGTVAQLSPAPFANEKELQRFFEVNLQELLGIRFVATEFTTGEKHGGRIDTLGLDEEGSPVIIEYKWDKSESVMNQGLFYLDWLLDHKGDFELVVQKQLGDAEVSWSAPRLILVASTYTKYDTYAVNQLSSRLELLRYQRYDDGTFTLESVNEPLTSKGKAPIELSPGKVKPDVEYTLEYHKAKTNDTLWTAFLQLRERLLALDGVEERVNQKTTITYRTTKSFAACDFNKNRVRCQFKGLEKIDDPERRAKDIRSYEWGYQWAVDVRDTDDVDYAYRLLKGAYDRES